MPASRYYSEAQVKRRRRTLTAVLMRSGTSKGLFIHRNQLPASESDWAPILLSAMGSRSCDKRQLDGVGGATSTTSKVAIVSKSKRLGIDIDYTFVQVAVGDRRIDMTGNCGNIASGVGPFALEEGLVSAEPGQTEMEIRIFNVNTGAILVETVQVDEEGGFLEEGDECISGFAGSGSRIKVNFVDPAGSMTGKLFPTGHRQDDITTVWSSINTKVTVRATLIDAANPFILVDSSTMPNLYHRLDPDSAVSLELIEAIRCEGAVMFGLAPTVEAAKLVRATPKIAVLSSPAPASEEKRQPNINVTAYSMGRLHPCLQVTGAVTLGSAVSLPGTIASRLSNSKGLKHPYWAPKAEDAPLEGEVCIAQRSGTMLANVILGDYGMVAAVSVCRTAQRLFEGSVMLHV